MAYTYDATDLDAAMAHGNSAGTVYLAFQTDLDTVGNLIETHTAALGEIASNELDLLLMEFASVLASAVADEADA